MIKTILQYVALFIILVFIQIICNNICIFGIAVPLLFIYFIIRLPISLSVNWVMTLSFLIGLIIDIFNNTQGMNALACTITASLRRFIFSIYLSREDDLNDAIPSIKSLGQGIYIKYLLTMVLVFCTLLFFIQAFTLHNLQLTIFRIIGSTILTAIILFGVDSLISESE